MEIISKPLAAVIAAGIMLVLMNGAGQAEISPRDRQALAQAELVFVATIRKNGTQSKAAPVWFTTDGANQAILIEPEHTAERNYTPVRKPTQRSKRESSLQPTTYILESVAVEVARTKCRRASTAIRTRVHGVSKNFGSG